MTERGAPSADTSPACPFVAFEDERDERADRPDHRHRCYAEAEPAPRALAHQEAYCLSSAFPVCPTFQEWARREAAHTRAGGAATPTPTAATVTSSDAEDGDASGDDSTDHDNEDDDSWERRRDDRPVEEPPRRNPPRDWAAPPPWAAGAAGLAGAASGAGAAGAAGAGSGRAGSGRPDFLGAPPEEGRGLVGSAADRLARGGHIADDPAPADLPPIRHSEHPSTPADPELAGLVGARASRNDPPPVARSGRQPTVSSTRDRDRERGRERERGAERSGHDGPAWEGPRRYEAYPQIKARASMPGMPGIPRIALLAGALAIAALALFFLPALLGVGGGNDPETTPSPSAVATATPEPTPIPAPTPQVYTIKAGDTLSKIAKAFGVTVDDLLAANKDTIKNKDRIVVGNQITIPVPASNEVGGEASGSPAP
jgi:nucleoid-associated protein YgaU